MPIKTDAKKTSSRSRIRYACKPELKDLLTLVNFFPPIDKWINVEKPFPLFPPLFPPGQTTQTTSPEYERTKLAWQENMMKAGIDLMNTIGNKIGGLAYFQIFLNGEVEKMNSLADKWDKTADDADDAIEMFHTTKNNIYKIEAILKLKQLPECEKEFYEYAANISEMWFARYAKIKQIKDFLTKLAFIEHNFDTAEKKLIGVGLVEFNEFLTNLYVDEDGILQREENILLQWLLGIDVRRIRQCAICRNLFWANRIDRQCCTKKCADAHNQRKSRENKLISGELYEKAAKRKKQAE